MATTTRRTKPLIIIPPVVPPLPRERPLKRDLPLSAPFGWLAAGWRDLVRRPGPSLAYGLAVFAVSLAIVSSLADRPIPAKAVAFGEIGLAGEVRPAPRGLERLREIAKLGFEKAIVPRANAPKAKLPGLEVLAVERVDQAVQLLRNL